MDTPTPTGARLRRRLLFAAAGLWAGMGAGARAATDRGPDDARAAPPAELSSALPGAALQGQVRFRWFGLHIYDARLWSRTRVRAESYSGAEFALELIYARRLQGTAIAERSLDEIRRLAEPTPPQREAWLAFMREAFPDVAAGDRITGLHRPGDGARFFHNGRATGALADARFGPLFFGIWLSPRSGEPALRRALLGEPA